MFAAYGNAMRTMDNKLGPRATGTTAYGRDFSAGFWAGLLQCVIVTPSDMVKCRLQVQNTAAAAGAIQPQYTGVAHCLRLVRHAKWVKH